MRDGATTLMATLWRAIPLALPITTPESLRAIQAAVSPPPPPSTDFRRKLDRLKGEHGFSHFVTKGLETTLEGAAGTPYHVAPGAEEMAAWELEDPTEKDNETDGEHRRSANVQAVMDAQDAHAMRKRLIAMRRAGTVPDETKYQKMRQDVVDICLKKTADLAYETGGSVVVEALEIGERSYSSVLINGAKERGGAPTSREYAHLIGYDANVIAAKLDKLLDDEVRVTQGTEGFFDAATLSSVGDALLTSELGSIEQSGSYNLDPLGAKAQAALGRVADGNPGLRRLVGFLASWLAGSGGTVPAPFHSSANEERKEVSDGLFRVTKYDHAPAQSTGYTTAGWHVDNVRSPQLPEWANDRAMFHFSAGEHFTQFRAPLLGILVTMRLAPGTILTMTADARGSSLSSRVPFVMFEASASFLPCMRVPASSLAPPHASRPRAALRLVDGGGDPVRRERQVYLLGRARVVRVSVLTISHAPPSPPPFLTLSLRFTTRACGSAARRSRALAPCTRAC